MCALPLPHNATCRPCVSRDVQVWRMHKNLKAMQDMLGSVLAAGRPSQSLTYFKPSGTDLTTPHGEHAFRFCSCLCTPRRSPQP